jgi:hypothetical protein
MRQFLLEIESLCRLRQRGEVMGREKIRGERRNDKERWKYRQK